MNLVLFSGGRGNKNLLNSFRDNDEDNLNKINVVVNGLDDGASTGMIREMLGDETHGISDFLKVTLAMSPNNKLVDFLEVRLPIIRSSQEFLELYSDIFLFIKENSNFKNIDSFDLNPKNKEDIKKYLASFIDYFFKKDEAIPNLSDFKIGNMVFASMLIEADLNFTKSLESFISFCDVDQKKFHILESTCTNSYIVGLLKNGILLPNEAAIVLTRTSDFIDSTYQIKKPLSAGQIREICSLERDDRRVLLSNLETIPSANTSVLNLLKTADGIIYGAGTPYSSLLPSLELGGIADAISASSAPKILVINLYKESANMVSGTDLIKSVINFIEKSAKNNIKNVSDYITHIVVPDEVDEKESLENYISTDKEDVEKHFDSITFIRADIRSDKNPKHHDGDKLLECIMKIINGS